jgi:hypothetical protein
MIEKLVRIALRDGGAAFVRPSAVVALTMLGPAEMAESGHQQEMGGTAVLMEGGHRLVLTLDTGLVSDVAHKLGLD